MARNAAAAGAAEPAGNLGGSRRKERSRLTPGAPKEPWRVVAKAPTGPCQEGQSPPVERVPSPSWPVESPELKSPERQVAWGTSHSIQPLQSCPLLSLAFSSTQIAASSSCLLFLPSACNLLPAWGPELPKESEWWALPSPEGAGQHWRSVGHRDSAEPDAWSELSPQRLGDMGGDLWAPLPPRVSGIPSKG